MYQPYGTLPDYQEILVRLAHRGFIILGNGASSIPGMIHYIDRDGGLTDGITWMSPDQADLISSEENTVVAEKMITTITAHVDRASNKRRIDVTFSETLARLIARAAGDRHQSGDAGNPSEGNAVCLCVDGEDDAGEHPVKKPGGSGVTSAAEHAYSVMVE